MSSTCFEPEGTSSGRQLYIQSWCGKFYMHQFNLLKPNDIYIYIYMSYRSANLQALHLKYLFNKYTY